VNRPSDPRTALAGKGDPGVVSAGVVWDEVPGVVARVSNDRQGCVAS
jgi:hypothetical protein